MPRLRDSVPSRPSVPSTKVTCSVKRSRVPSGSPMNSTVATVEFIADGARTRLRFTEQVTFVDGTDGRQGTASRQRGTAAHLDRIAGCL